MKVACPTFERSVSPPSGIIAVMTVIQMHVVSIPLGRLHAHWPSRHVADLKTAVRVKQ